MKRGPSQAYLRDLDWLYQMGAVGGLTDRELLAHFLVGDGAIAQRSFEALVHRHGPMVLEVCRRVVRDAHTAEDAFQATFLVLALKVHTIRKRDSLGPWLHGVAVRIARRARDLSRRPEEQQLPPDVPDTRSSVQSGLEAADLYSVLDEEVARLPEVYRRAVVLCYVEGKTQREAARELGWTKGTVSGRLARAKDLLRARLTRRGLAPSVGLLAGMLSEGQASALPATLADRAVRSAVGIVLGRGEGLAGSGTAMTLARGALRTMMLGQMTLAAAVLVMLVAFATALAQTGVATAPDHGDSREPRTAPPARPAGLPPHAIARLGTTRLRHEDIVSGLAFAPDGRSLATAGWDRAVRFWDLSTGESSTRFPTLRGPDGALSLAYSPDGTRLVIGYDAGWVRLWDLAAGKELLRTKIHHGDVQSVAFTPDGRTFATSGYDDPIVRIWDAETGRELRTLACRDEEGFRGKLTFRGQLAFSRDGKRLALGAPSARADGERIVLWDLEKDGDPTVIEKAHDTGLKSLLFTPAGDLISCGAAQMVVREPGERMARIESRPQIRIWDAATGRKLRELDLGFDPGHCKAALAPDGKTLVSLLDDRIVVWDLGSGKIARRFHIRPDVRDFGRGVGIAISPDGRMLASERHDHVVHVWDIATGTPLFSDSTAHVTTVTAAISPDGRLAATGDDRGHIRIWDPARGTLLHRLELGGDGRVASLRFAPDGRSLAAAGESYDGRRFSGLARFWAVPEFPIGHRLPLARRAVGVAYSPDGRRVAVATSNTDPRKQPADQAIELFDAATGRRLTILLPGRGERIYDLAFTPDGRTLIVADDNGDAIRFWDVASGRQNREIPIAGRHAETQHDRSGHVRPIGAVTILPDRMMAATSGLDGDQVLVWDLEAGRVRRTLPTEDYRDATLALSPDGRSLAVATTPRTGDDRAAPIRLWDIATKRELLRLDPGVDGVRSLAFSADGKRLISGMSDTTALIWDVSAIPAAGPSRPAR